MDYFLVLRRQDGTEVDRHLIRPDHITMSKTMTQAEQVMATIEDGAGKVLTYRGPVNLPPGDGVYLTQDEFMKLASDNNLG